MSVNPMVAVERSAALRRMGIVEWLPRQDVAVVAMPFPNVKTSEISSDVHPGFAAETAKPYSPVDLPIQVLKSAAVSPVSTQPLSSAVAYAQTAPGLRGRLLRTGPDAPLLVVALAEKLPRDAFLHPDTGAGALLNAMLGTLAVPASVAVIGVERGEAIVVPPTILVLGERSARALLGAEIAPPFRGRVHLFGQSRVVVSYHPDELRQNSSLKRLAWDDLRLLAGLLANNVVEAR